MSDEEERKDPDRSVEAMEQGAGLPPGEAQPKAKTAEAKALKSDLSNLNEANEEAGWWRNPTASAKTRKPSATR